MRISQKAFLSIMFNFLKNELLRKIPLTGSAALYGPSPLIDLKITLRCNLKCLQCPVWQVQTADELSTSSWEKIFLEIKEYVGPYFLRFYGGEPFCRRDLFELINFCSSHGIHSLITTNGTFIDKEVAHQLIREKVLLINISIDGARPETHDRLRGVRGTFDKAMRAIENLQGKIPLQINTTIMEDNLDEIIELSLLARRHKVEISFQGLANFAMSGADSYRLETGKNNLFPEREDKALFVIDELIQRKKDNKFIVNTVEQLNLLKRYYKCSIKEKRDNCGAIRNNHLMIKEKGDVFICSLSKPIGNLTYRSLRDIWHSKEKVQVLDEMKMCTIDSCLVMRGYAKEDPRGIWRKVKRYILDMP